MVENSDSVYGCYKIHSNFSNRRPNHVVHCYSCPAIAAIYYSSILIIRDIYVHAVGCASVVSLSGYLREVIILVQKQRRLVLIHLTKESR